MDRFFSAATTIALLMCFGSIPVFAQYEAERNEESTGRVLGNQLHSTPCRFSRNALKQIREKGESGIILVGIQFDLNISVWTGIEPFRRISLERYLQGIGQNYSSSIFVYRMRYFNKSHEQDSIGNIKFISAASASGAFDMDFTTMANGREFIVRLGVAGKDVGRRLSRSQIEKVFEELFECK